MESNPFAIDILEATDASAPAVDRVVLHGEAYGALMAALSGVAGGGGVEKGGKGGEGQEGELILLASPEAGCGKTHLLARVRRAAAETHLALPLTFGKDHPGDWETALNLVLEYCDVEEGASGGISILEEVARRTFARLTAEMIRDERIPAADAKGAMKTLTSQPVEVFDFRSGEGDVVKWFSSVFESLLPSMAAEAARSFSISEGQAVFWLRGLHEYSGECAGGNAGGRERSLWRMAGEEEEKEKEGEQPAKGERPMASRERFGGLVKILSAWRPLFFVVEHLDSLFGDEEEGNEVASVLVDLPLLAPRSLTVLSVNMDLWESIFNGALPGAIEDRLTAQTVVIRGVSLEEARKLVDARLLAGGIPDDVKFRFLPMLDLADLFEGEGPMGISPRSVLRHAKNSWDRFAEAGYEVVEKEEISSIGEEGEEEIAPSVREKLKAKAEGEGEVEATSKKPIGRKKNKDEGTGKEKEGVEFVSLTEGPLKIFDSPFAPLEPLRFEDYLTFRTPMKKARREKPSTTETAPIPTSPERERAPEPGEKEKAEEKGKEKFDWKGAAARALKGAGAKVRGKAEAEPGAERKEEGPPKAKEPVIPEVMKEKTPEVKEEATPDLEITVESLLEEAKEAFSGFHDIFKHAMDEEIAAGEALIAEMAGEEVPAAEVEGEEVPEAKVPEAESAAEKKDERGEGEGESLAAYFNGLRREAATKVDDQELDPVRFYSVMRAVGDFFPMVTQNEFDLPDKPGYRVASWSYENSDVLFGFLPVKNAEYWKSLLDYALQFGAAGGGSGWGGEGREVKVVALVPAAVPLDVAPWLASMDIQPGKRPLVDSIGVHADTVAAIYAAAQLLEEVATNRVPQSKEEVLKMLTRELDFFWRRLTRKLSSDAPTRREK